MERMSLTAGSLALWQTSQIITDVIIIIYHYQIRRLFVAKSLESDFGLPAAAFRPLSDVRGPIEGRKIFINPA
jgi:hypothetical protein